MTTPAAWDWIRADLVEIADEFLRKRQWLELPQASYYREHVTNIQEAAEHLLKVLRNAPTDAVWELSQRTARGLGIPLRQPSRTTDGKRLPPIGFEHSLVSFVSICRTITGEQSKRAPRPREDLVSLALGLAGLWSKLAQRRFPKTLSVMVGVPGMDNPQDPEFESPGPQFVRQLMPAFDSSLQFTEIRTALKALPVKALSIQQITAAEPQSVDRDPLAIEAEFSVDSSPGASPSPARVRRIPGTTDADPRSKNTPRRLARRNES